MVYKNPKSAESSRGNRNKSLSRKERDTPGVKTNAVHVLPSMHPGPNPSKISTHQAHPTSLHCMISISLTLYDKGSSIYYVRTN